MKTLIGLVFIATLLTTDAYSKGSRKLNYKITTTWDNRRLKNQPIKISLSWDPDNDHITAEFSGPFFNDPPAPNGPPGQPFFGLWEFEVAEIFFLDSASKQYLEVEVSPHGQHLVLLLNGQRNVLDSKLPLVYSAKIKNDLKTWRGVAQIPLSYIPRGVDKMNAYAIHGSGKNRVFKALYPVPTGKFENPDFHRLNYFHRFNIRKIVKDTSKLGKFWDQYFKQK